MTIFLVNCDKRLPSPNCLVIFFFGSWNIVCPWNPNKSISIFEVSIILLTVPLFILLAGDMNPYAFAIFGILAIEAGLLTPPFGLIVYTVKGVLAAGGDNVSLGSIFKGSIPYWIMMLIVMLLVAFFPELASWPTQFV